MIDKQTIKHYIENNIDSNIEEIIDFIVLINYIKVTYSTSILNEKNKKIEILIEDLTNASRKNTS